MILNYVNPENLNSFFEFYNGYFNHFEAIDENTKL